MESPDERMRRSPYLRFQHWAIGFLAVAAFFEIIALIVFPFGGYDSPYHLFWIGQWHKLWNAGIFYPRWLPDSFRGFGAPSFYFYPPLTFVLTSAIYALLPNLIPEAIGKLLGLLVFCASGVSMLLYLRWRGRGAQTEVRATHAPILGAMLYMFAPYHFFDYSIRGALSEHLAFVFVPLVFWGIDLLAERRTPGGTRQGMLLLALAFSLLFLSNLPAATVTGFGALIYALARDRNGRAAMLGKVIFSTAVAVLLVAFYFLPIAVLFGEVQLGRLWYPVSLVLSSPFIALFSGKNLMINNYSLLSLLGGCILIVGYWPVPWKRINSVRKDAAIFWICAMVVFLQLPYVSQFLFSDIPPFTIVQLSYRFSILLLFVICLSWVSEVDTVDNNERGMSWLRPPTTLVVILWSLGSIGLVSVQLANIHVHVNKLPPVGDAPEYTPRWSQPYDDFGAALSALFANDSQYVLWRGEQREVFLSDVRQPYSDSITYDSPIAGSLLLRRSYWPTWKASLDGAPITTGTDSLGRLTISAPAGKHRIAVSLATETSARIGTWISAGALIILCLLWIVV